MAAQTQPSEGLAQVQYRLTLPQKQYLNFDPDRVTFVSAVVSDSVTGTGGGSEHVLRTIDPSFLSALKRGMLNVDPIFEFRLGFGDPKNTYWLPWQKHIIIDVHANYEGISNTAGHLLVINTANDLVRMQRSNKVSARKGSVSSIIQTIASENKLTAVIEPTDGEFTFIQNFMDDTRFINERLLPRAVNKQGHGGYFFFIRDGVMHFHTLDYQTTVSQLNYYGAPSAGLETVDQSQAPVLWDSGIAGMRYVVHDPYTGESKDMDSNPNKAVKLANSIYQFDNTVNGSCNVPYHMGTNQIIETQALAQFGYQRSRLDTFNVRVTMPKTINIRHGDLLNLVVAQEASRTSTDSGFYYVTCVTHTVNKTQIMSVYTLGRGELQKESGGITVQNDESQLASETDAPGQTPNILQAQNSELTVGAGKQSSAKTFSVVADANTGQ